MKFTDFTKIVPAQYTGTEMKATCSRELNDENSAKAFYEEAKHRLLNVKDWYHAAGITIAHFQLIDQNGKEANRSAEKGD
ncbi:MAG: hypothetical protein ACXVNN_11095 [Bacteroidia bacterium]